MVWVVIPYSHGVITMYIDILLWQEICTLAFHNSTLHAWV